MSDINPGTSINFDARALHDAEEEEYHWEEKERENELRAALMNAFDDDLSDEDSDVSRDHGNSIVSQDTEPINHKQQVTHSDEDDNHLQVQGQNEGHLPDPMSTPFPAHHGYLQHHLIGQTSTPLTGHDAPVLTTPQYYQHWDHEENYANYAQQYGNYHTHDHNQYIPDGYYGNTDSRIIPNERGEIEGANEEDNVYSEGIEHFQQYHGNYAYYPETNYMPDNLTYGPMQDTIMPAPTHERPESGRNETGRKSPLPPLLPGPDMDSYKVTYQGLKQKISSNHSTKNLAAAGTAKPNNTTPPRPTTSGADYQELQKQFLNTGSNQQLEQLQILYSARGRKLEELTQQLKATQEDTDREIRILRHKLTLAQDERNGLSSSLEQCQQLLKDAKCTDAELLGKVSALQAQIDAQSAAKDDMIRTMRSQESTIESLTAQLMSLEASDSLSRAREQHEAAMSSLRQKHEAQVYLLKENLDIAQRSIEEKDKEIETNRKQLNNVRKNMEEAQINRADTINRLTRSLEDSQKQCQELLESGSGQELSRLKLQLQEVIASRSISDDLNSALQLEIKELKEEVVMYESASHVTTLGHVTNSTANAKNANFDDSYAQLGIRPDNNWQTPDTNRSTTPTFPTDSTVHGLKTELERCLHMYKNKRHQVISLQDQLKSTKKSLEELKATTSRTEMEAKEYKDKLMALEEKLGDAAVADNPREVLSRREMEKLTKERDLLAAELEDARTRLQESAANEERVAELNSEISTQMSQMIREFDEDKQQALDKCQEAVLHHHEDMCHRLKQELNERFSEEKQQLNEEWQAKYTHALSDLHNVQKNLDEIKNLYVVVCEEKDQLEEHINAEYASKLEHQLNELQAKLESEYEGKMEELKLSVNNNNLTSLTSAKENWLKEQESEVTRKIQLEVARGKAEWFTEHQVARDQAIERALKVSNMEWQQKWDTTFNENLEAELAKVQEEWNSLKEAEIQKRLEEMLEAARTMWRESELLDKLVAAEQDWRQTEEDNIRSQLQEEANESGRISAPELASAECQTENSEIQSPNKNMKELESACESLKLELDKIHTEKALLSKELQDMKESWTSEKQKLLSEKQKELEALKEQSEREYTQFLEEHRETINKALASARQEHNFQMAKLKEQHRAELETSKKPVQSPSDNEEEKRKLIKEWEERLEAATAEKEQLQMQWEAHMSEITAHLESEKNELISMHRENMAKALDEARQRWQKKLEDVMAENEQTLLMDREALWESERAQYIAIINEREELLQAADAHMETEMNKLHEQLQTQLQESGKNPDEDQSEYLREFENNLHAEFQEHLKSTIQDLEDNLNQHHEEHLQAELEKIQQIHEDEFIKQREEFEAEKDREIEERIDHLRKELVSEYDEEKTKLKLTIERDFEDRLSTSKSEMEKLLYKLEETRKQLKDLYGKYTKDTKNLSRKGEQQEQELAKFKVTVEQYQDTIKDLTHDKQDLSLKVADLVKQVEKAEKLQQEVVESMKKSEKEHGDIIDSYKARCTELDERVHKTDAQITMLKSEAQRALKLRESLETEHNVVVGMLKSKIVEMNQKHNENIKRLHKQHDGEMQRVIVEMSNKDDAAVKEIRDHYLVAVEKIREDVVKHMSQSNERSAATMKIHVIRERQLTARRLRKYYMKCLAHILEKDCDPDSKEKKLQAMERLLDNLPLRSSRSSTPSLPSSSNSKSHTPVNTEQTDSSTLEDPNMSVDQMQNSDYLGHSQPASSSSSRPDSAGMDLNDSWVTTRSLGARPISMTYPAPSLKTNSPSGGRKSADQVREKSTRHHYGGKNSERKLQHQRSQLETSFDLGLSVSTPNLAPRQVGFTDVTDVHPERISPDDITSLDRNTGLSLASSDYKSKYLPPKSDNRNNAGKKKYSAYGNVSPLDDILDKYAIGNASPRPTSVGDGELPASTKSTASRSQFTRPRTQNMQLTKSTEYLNRDSKLSVAPMLSTASGYKYTSLCNNLASKGQSKSTTNLQNMLEEFTSNHRSRSPPHHRTTFKSPPERIPPTKTEKTHSKSSFMPRLQLQSVDVNLNDSENQESTTPRADREVASFSERKMNGTNNAVDVYPTNFQIQNNASNVKLTRPVPLVTRQTQAP